MSGAGWVKLHRKFCEWEWFDDPNTLKLFIYLMTHVNFERKNWHGVEVLPGQMITGRQKLAVAVGLSEQSIRTSIKRLKSTSDLTIKVTNKYSVITLTNWAKYQSIDTELTSKVTGNLTNNQPATNQQLTTTKEGEECKEGKEVKKTSMCVPNIEIMNQFEKCWIAYGRYGVKKSALKYWKQLKQEKRDLIERKIPVYLECVALGRAKKQFEGWINPANELYSVSWVECKGEMEAKAKQDWRKPDSQPNTNEYTGEVC